MLSKTIPGRFEAGQSLGYKFRLEGAENPGKSEFHGVPKPPISSKSFKARRLQDLYNLHKAKKSFRINNAQSQRQSQEVV